MHHLHIAYEGCYFVFRQKLIHTSLVGAVWDPKRTFFAQILKTNFQMCVFQCFYEVRTSQLKASRTKPRFLRGANLAAYQIESSNENTKKVACESLLRKFL